MKEIDYYLKEFEILIPKSDLEIITKLKDQNNLSKEDLALVGDIIITSWRAYS